LFHDLCQLVWLETAGPMDHFHHIVMCPIGGKVGIEQAPFLVITLKKPRVGQWGQEGGLHDIYAAVDHVIRASSQSFRRITIHSKNEPPARECLRGEFPILYSLVRILGEIFREPDASLIWGMSRGSFYSLFLIIAGLSIVYGIAAIGEVRLCANG
jgi:hypothetical protein